MKLDQLLPRTGIPAGAPYPNVSGDAMAAPATAAARGFQGLESQALVAIAAAERADQAKREVEIRTDAARLQAEMELEIGTIDSALRSTERDPDAFLSKRTEQVNDVVARLTERAKYPESVALLRPKVPGILGRSELRAREHADGLFIGREEAKLVTTLDTYTRLAGATPFDDDREFARLYTDAAGALDAFEPVIGAKRAAEARVKLREDLFNERARRHSQDDPAWFLASGGKYGGMDPNKRDTYTAQAKGAVLAQQKDADTKFGKWLTGVEKEADTEREARMMTLSDKATAGSLTVADVQRERGYSTFKTREELEHYLKLATSEPKRVREESDPETYFQLANGLRQVNPATTKRQLNKALEDGLLVRKDWDALTKELLSRTDAAKDERKADVLRRHNQVEENFRLWLGVTPGMEGLRAHDERVTLLSEMFRELTTRSSALGGTEDPAKIEGELFERYQPRRDRAFRVSGDAANAMRSFPNVDEAGLKVMRDQGKISEEVYKLELQRLKREQTIRDKATDQGKQLPTSKAAPVKK